MLKPCRVCGQEVATEAKACPHCGAPHPTDEKAASAARLTSLGCALTVLVTVPILLGTLLLGMCA